MVIDDVALVLQGGGARGIFIAGVTDAMLDAGLDFPYIVGTSAGALIGYNVVSRQRGRAKSFIVEGMADKRFASFGNLVRTGSYFGFDYMFDVFPEERFPFNTNAFETSKARFFCGTTCVNDGTACYFEKERKDFDVCASASSTLPFLGRPIEIDGKLYMDGSSACPIPFRKPLEDGVKKIVVITTRARDYRKKKHGSLSSLLYKVKYHNYPNYLQAMLHEYEVYNKDMEDLFDMEKSGNAFLIMPKTAPTVERTEKNPSKLEEFYEEGYSQGQEIMPKLIEFLRGGQNE